jgi:hypothetical protein
MWLAHSCIRQVIFGGGNVKTLQTGLFFFLICVAGCNKAQEIKPQEVPAQKVAPPETLIQIDTRTDAFTAQTVCNYRTRQAKAAPTWFMPCLDPGTNSKDVEQAFRSAVLASPACVGVTVVDMAHDGSEDKPGAFSLCFSVVLDKYSDLSMKDSGWGIQPSLNTGVNQNLSASGKVGNMQETTANICSIVKGAGGKTQ